ncbi:DegT/DnrJ/EryC1/StrS family aminotransferase [Azospirillum rugosum]|uniref:dTDP-4-amino-4,6-dideoxygalactose transaminase n=1 Tax=Azospirillum rugosum TaxID=416170 RepID=A0ABS4SFU8_9PROT|nr:DegT/DnrJ/EryC1/StrS family aminotransferase [Azospirillum rugosum]MBP2291435.1 dTDP-4-amino-4,6-dideoxygalactose transaminase [Azospirillum rugosum]MDQ0525223.1 dTDP-4-amino-4,6-dideoxygalactose transaminase [Azospirillum rugosum]
MIPYLDLQSQYRSIRPEVEKAVLDVLASGQYVLGAPVEDFEKRFARYCGVRHCVAVNTGTSALHLALLAAGIGPGDEVITVPMTFMATVAAIVYTGAKPVLVDIDPRSWTMDPAKVEAAITPRTKAILPVHLHGQMADMAPLLDIARTHGLTLIEDACQAHGARYRGQTAGSLGDAGCFSFYPGKNLGAAGEGGALVTDRDDIAEQARLLRDWGQTVRYRHDVMAFNYRMDAIQGAVLGVKLSHLDGWTEARRAVAAQYDEHLAEGGMALPARIEGRRHVYHVYAVCVPERDRVRGLLNEAGVSTGIHYPIPIHLQPACADLGYGPGDFPVTERFARETLSLPIFPEMTGEQIADAAKALRSAVATLAG